MYDESDIIEPVGPIEPIEQNETSSLSVANCNFQDDYQGYDNKPFRYSKTPQNKVGYHILNPKSVQNKYSKDFDKISVDGKCVYVTSTPDGSVKSNMHNGQNTLVDVPYRDSGIYLNEMGRIYTDKSLDKYKTGYTNYNEIMGGDIFYYVNKQNEDPFFSPVFSSNSDYNTTSVMYKDPMGGLKPQYIRHSNKQSNKINDRNSFEYSLSWIEDSNEYREDLLAMRIQKLNENRWDARWNSPEN